MAVAVAALPFKAGGCGSTACITVTPAQLVGGACPSASTALMRFGNGCGTIYEVNGAGSLDGNFCCYSVQTQSGDQTDSLGICGNGVGGGVTMGSVTVSSSFSSAGVGGTGGIGPFSGSGGFTGTGGNGGASTFPDGG